MDRDQRYIHLGIDINVPAGSEIRFPAAAEVLNTCTSPDVDVGWGTRADLKHPALPLVFIIGHLSSDLQVRTGSRIQHSGQFIGEAGSPPLNGNVDPHIHIQAMELQVYEDKMEADDLDGYGRAIELEFLKQSCPCPLRALQLFLQG